MRGAGLGPWSRHRRPPCGAARVRGGGWEALLPESGISKSKSLSPARRKVRRPLVPARAARSCPDEMQRVGAVGTGDRGVQRGFTRARTTQQRPGLGVSWWPRGDASRKERVCHEQAWGKRRGGRVRKWKRDTLGEMDLSRRLSFFLSLSTVPQGLSACGLTPVSSPAEALNPASPLFQVQRNPGKPLQGLHLARSDSSLENQYSHLPNGQVLSHFVCLTGTCNGLT